MALVQGFKQLRVYSSGFEAAMRIFEYSKQWPRDERYALTDQIRRSSRSVCGNIAEAWRKRLYVPNFVSKLSDASAEAAETQVWLSFARECGYLDATVYTEIDLVYHQIGGGLVKMMAEAETWCGPATLREEGGEYTVNGMPDDNFENAPLGS